MISQLERLNSNETKIAPRSVWIAVNGSDLSAPTFMVSSKMDGSDPHFDAESIATHNTSWDLEKDDVALSGPSRSPRYFRGCGTGAGCRCCGAAGSAAFCRSIATMPSPLRPADPEAALPSQIASKGSLGLRAPAGIEVAAIVVAALYFGREVLIPVTLAMLLSFVLSPLVELLR
ncbi:MAG TPA: hypothetical protein VGL45_10030, partial [Bradyrhizobium sp.]